MGADPVVVIDAGRRVDDGIHTDPGCHADDGAGADHGPRLNESAGQQGWRSGERRPPVPGRVPRQRWYASRRAALSPSATTNRSIEARHGSAPSRSPVTAVPSCRSPASIAGRWLDETGQGDPRPPSAGSATTRPWSAAPITTSAPYLPVTLGGLRIAKPCVRPPGRPVSRRRRPSPDRRPAPPGRSSNSRPSARRSRQVT